MNYAQFVLRSHLLISMMRERLLYFCDIILILHLEQFA